eukprot:3269512-Prymnesium_polylepis.1
MSVSSVFASPNANIFTTLQTRTVVQTAEIAHSRPDQGVDDKLQRRKRGDKREDVCGPGMRPHRAIGDERNGAQAREVGKYFQARVCDAGRVWDEICTQDLAGCEAGDANAPFFSGVLAFVTKLISSVEAHQMPNVMQYGTKLGTAGHMFRSASTAHGTRVIQVERMANPPSPELAERTFPALVGDGEAQKVGEEGPPLPRIFAERHRLPEHDLVEGEHHDDHAEKGTRHQHRAGALRVPVDLKRERVEIIDLGE